LDNPWKKVSSVNPQRENGRREIANKVWLALIKASLTAGEYKVLMTVIDRTWGYGVLVAEISLTCFESTTALSRRGICKVINDLETRRLVVVSRNGTKRSIYMFNKHYDTWLDSAGEPQFTSTGELQFPSPSVASEPQFPSEDSASEPEYTSLGNHSSLDEEPQFTSTRELATPATEATKENILKKTSKEISKEIESLFDLWNTQGVIKHKTLTDKMKTALKNALRSYTLEEISGAMKVYAEITLGEQYWWSYRWTLEDFLRRGGLEKFMDAEAARENYHVDKSSGPKNNVKRLAGRTPTKEQLDEQERRYFR
jgi:hypothetical protein